MTHSVFLCIACNQEVQDGIFTGDFIPTLIKVILPIIILVPLLIIYFKTLKSGDRSTTQRIPVIMATLTLGIGMGGFVDAITLHQILQWHQMLSNQISFTNFEGKSINMFWDGMFEAVTWIITMVGITLLWHSRSQPNLQFTNNLFIGGLLAGWGIFNSMDSIFNHYLFSLHNVKEIDPNPELWNLGFLIFSFILIIVGWLIIRKK
ncbi:DUF2243 domain-containing protein [Litoribacter populi]|uniref:DUF2243 domain-containing protein n=1 Tax=Litoribacter populi TaxID=2598460 RepID=UPI00117CFF4A|nr:DUF2243 domain-containing protein [Litoribacter populi]